MNDKAYELVGLLKSGLPPRVADEIEYQKDSIKDGWESAPEDDEILVHAFDRVLDEALENNQGVFKKKDADFLKDVAVKIGWAEKFDVNAVRIGGKKHWFSLNGQKYEPSMSFSQFFGIS